MSPSDVKPEHALFALGVMARGSGHNVDTGHAGIAEEIFSSISDTAAKRGFSGKARLVTAVRRGDPTPAALKVAAEALVFLTPREVRARFKRYEQLERDLRSFQQTRARG